MRVPVMLSAALVVCAASSAGAQDTVGGIVDFLVTTNQEVPTGVPERDRAAAEAARDTITRALLANFTSLPIASSSGGFIYRLNPELGTVERATESFGTFFVERALTPGRGSASFGVSFAAAPYDRLGGLRLREGIVTVANQFLDEAEPYDIDTLRLRIASSVMTVFGNIGLTDRLEIGAVVPFVRLTLEGDRINSYWAGGRTRGVVQSFTRASASATASGVADVALRAKYALLGDAAGGLAAAVEARLPTGDEENLLGSGTTAWRFVAIGSMERGRAAVHGNAGVVRGALDEITFSGAASLAAHPRMTISGELLGRRVSGLGRISLASAEHPNVKDVITWRLLPDDSEVLISTAVGGLKWNVTRALVLAGHVARPLSGSGLRAPISGTISLEYSLGQ